MPDTSSAAEEWHCLNCWAVVPRLRFYCNETCSAESRRREFVKYMDQRYGKGKWDPITGLVHRG